MPAFFETVASTMRRHAMLAGGERVVIGVSGGADSVALLLALRTLGPSFDLALHVLHVDHGLRAESARDGEFVRDLAACLGVPCEVARVTVARGGSLEAQARAARYAALEARADAIGAARIAVGHTRDDQAETVLMRVLEGAGPRGLAGIPPTRGRVIRPLLEVGRGDVLAALGAAGLPWIEDPSNLDLKFLRNRVRHELLPLLTSAYRGDVVDALNLTAVRMRSHISALDRCADAELARLASWGEGEVTFSRAALLGLPRELAADVLRLAAARLGSRAPLRAWAYRGLGRALADPAPRRPFRLGGVTVEVSGERMRLAARRRAALATHALAVPGRTFLPEIGQVLEARELPATEYTLPRDARHAVFDADRLPGPLVARGRRRGDRLVAFGGGARRLKSLLIAAKVPRWERDRVPVVEAGTEVLWVAGVRRAAAAPVTPGTRRVLELALVAGSA
jgi:tRNA(Ile)-lysidine synthase